MDDSIKRLIELGINATPALKELDKLGKETEKQTQQLDGLQKTLNDFGAGIKGVFSGLAIGEAVMQVVTGVREMINSLDDLNDQAQQVGQSVESLQEIQHAFSMSGMSAEDAIPAMARLSDKLGEVGDESSNTGRLLRVMGVTVEDTVDTALAKMAEAFQNAPDGINKTNTAIEIFGRSMGTKMVTLLNEGAEGLERMREEAQKLGIASEETAKQAAEFNDNLDRLSAQARALGIMFTAEVLPTLISLSKWVLENTDNIKSLTMKFIELTSPALNAALAMRRFWRSATGADEKEAIEANKKSVEALGASVTKFAEDMQKTDLANVKESPIEKWFRGIKTSGDDAALRMEKISRLSAEIAKLDPAKDADKLKEYNKQLKALQDNGEKAAKSTKAVKEQKDAFTQWAEALAKAQEQIDLGPQKIAYLEAALATLNAQGKGASEWAEKLQAELLKLRPDPVAEAIKKIADSAKDLEATPRVMQGIADELARLEAAGKGATVYATKLREELLKMEAAKDPIAAVTLELEKMRAETVRNAEVEAEWFRRLGEGSITVAEFAKGVGPYLADVQQGVRDTTKEVDKLAESIVEMGAKFVTDFVDQMIDGMGKAEVNFEDMITSMIKQLAKLLIQMQAANLVKSFSIGAAATGAAFDAQGVEFMASGGILSRPTFFASGGRLAVAGEAGPEAVVPLQRAASGDLGVAASPVNVQVNNYTDATVQTTSRDNIDGSKTIQLEIRRQVKAALTDGSMDRTMRSSYGLSRQPVIG